MKFQTAAPHETSSVRTQSVGEELRDTASARPSPSLDPSVTLTATIDPADPGGVSAQKAESIRQPSVQAETSIFGYVAAISLLVVVNLVMFGYEVRSVFTDKPEEQEEASDSSGFGYSYSN
jgi:hypothetical protein